jgi:GDP-D-mannose dehydratase
MRPAEVEFLCGDATKAREQLNWIPKTSFKELVKKMVNSDVKLYSSYGQHSHPRFDKGNS